MRIGVLRMNEIKFVDNVIYVKDSVIEFEEKVAKVKKIADRFFVLLKIPPQKFLNYNDCHNVYCYNLDGKRIWQIGDSPKGRNSVFTMIQSRGSILYVNDFLGRRFIVDQQTGTLSLSTVTK